MEAGEEQITIFSYPMKNRRILALALASFAVLGLSTPCILEAAASKADAAYIQKVADGEMSAAGLA